MIPVIFYYGVRSPETFTWLNFRGTPIEKSLGENALAELTEKAHLVSLISGQDTYIARGGNITYMIFSKLVCIFLPLKRQFLTTC